MNYQGILKRVPFLYIHILYLEYLHDSIKQTKSIDTPPPPTTRKHLGFLPVYRKVLVWPPITTSTPSTSVAILVSTANPAWPRAMILLTPWPCKFVTSERIDVTSSSNFRLPVRRKIQLINLFKFIVYNNINIIFNCVLISSINWFHPVVLKLKTMGLFSKTLMTYSLK